MALARFWFLHGNHGCQRRATLRSMCSSPTCIHWRCTSTRMAWHASARICTKPRRRRTWRCARCTWRISPSTGKAMPLKLHLVDLEGALENDVLFFKRGNSSFPGSLRFRCKKLRKILRMEALAANDPYAPFWNLPSKMVSWLQRCQRR